eukprot:TRINITY_DN54952_c0_g1_i1.p1 TRINITY_DN54952_c0_g1~~TRINITY_DN54952_c0_g1_i1.p1  ORF type:complete len:653 (-),score=94.80 TRINITY_DN54952_c0_g1_i1:68-2026(-)
MDALRCADGQDILESPAQSAEFAAWDDPNWDEKLRPFLRGVPGNCVLDLRESNILTYAQGDWTLIQRDLQCAFSEGVSANISACIENDLRSCYSVRRELINYKKLCLHMWKTGSTLEKDLRQLASFFFNDLVKDSASVAEKERYNGIANTMNECRGAVNALWDARHFGKAICALPRLPESGVPWKFEELPESLEVSKTLVKATQFISNHDALQAYLTARKVRQKGLDTGADTVDELVSKPVKKELVWKSERVLVPSSLSNCGLRTLMNTLDVPEVGLAKSALRYVELVLIARGASKALAVREALRRYCKALREVVAEASKVVNDLVNLVDSASTSTSSISAGLLVHCEKHQRLLKGVVAVVPEMLRWLEPIAACRGDSERLFVSGASGAAAFVPSGFRDLLQPYRTVARIHRDSMLAALALGAWPKSARPHPEEETNLVPCSRCGEKYTKLWLHRDLCFTCENALRSEGRCPYRDRCGRRSFCPHDQRCIVCEQWSCEQCHLVRGDGEDVWQIALQLRPALIFLDFDRTLATTKAGASPLVGSHSVDPDLAAVCTGYGHVHIVTQSTRTGDIEKFLAGKGVPVCHVHGLKRGSRQTKAEVILEELSRVPSSGQVGGLFVDDNILELTDPALLPLVEQGKLHRLLFVRAGGKD